MRSLKLQASRQKSVEKDSIQESPISDFSGKALQERLNDAQQRTEQLMLQVSEKDKTL